MARPHKSRQAPPLAPPPEPRPVTRARLPVLLTALVSGVILLIYLAGTVNGSFNHIFLPAKMFGIPSALQEKGITPLYVQKNETGWDGQFYYSIANDPFALKDTPQFIDSPAYRYQRIGLPLLAHIAAVLTFQDWVSPALYYGLHALLILLATGFAARFFTQERRSPFFILFWSLGVGTQLTLLNGLPDAAADSLLILSLLAILSRHRAIAIVCLTFAALSREIYLLVPCFLGLIFFIQTLRRHGKQSVITRQGWKDLAVNSFIHGLPVIVVGGWHLFIRWRFGVFASSQAAGILGAPFASLWEHLSTGITGQHWLVGKGASARYEGFGVLLFALVLGVALAQLGCFLRQDWATIRRKKPTALTEKETALFGLSLSFFAIGLSYFCFGKTVMMHYTGYAKALTLFSFLIPFFQTAYHKPIRKELLLFLFVVFVYFSYGLWQRVTAEPYMGNHATTDTPRLETPGDAACLHDYAARLEFQGWEEFIARPRLMQIIMRPLRIAQLTVTNTSRSTFEAVSGQGSVNIAARWINAKGELIAEGQRTLLPQLKPNQSVKANVIVPLPRKEGDYTLTLSLVQEGCAWFYEKNPRSAYTIPIRIRK